jgi:hypothetical protein
MATILLFGSSSSLLDESAQTLAAAGHRPRVARTLAEVRELAASSPPLVLLAEHALAADVSRLPLAPGGALLLCRAADDPATPLPLAVQRAALADLTLPLERHRLLALVAYVVERAARTGRARTPTPPEHRAL